MYNVEISTKMRHFKNTLSFLLSSVILNILKHGNMCRGDVTIIVKYSENFLGKYFNGRVRRLTSRTYALYIKSLLSFLNEGNVLMMLSKRYHHLFNLRLKRQNI